MGIHIKLEFLEKVPKILYIFTSTLTLKSGMILKLAVRAWYVTE